MSINISEKPFAHQYDHYAIDAGSYRQRIQDNKNNSTAASGLTRWRFRTRAVKR